ncbi:ABC transporter ATP-binding protein [Pseudoduganella namucuonensis]|uniref:Amino acid/amide ABC transporter ATP-binding protein 2, HAAT family n=1 Tax=Pseudoduganella namucuonensis TaxID=1035707 RepID=A0A1I7JGG1_9BURK|nr:ABC transporter ATP-binding protein [Pseudoduganella namucuonensis]SFU84244.1 amino acid/amide ABC transporter ATP-binding protein 2, HAAT family [Pseudoduganella namucuonensis]
MLEVEGLRAGYGAINVLWDVSLAAQPGRLTAIIGPNGAGKTTLLRAIMGLIPATSGQVRLHGAPLGGTPTWDMAAAGVAMIPEGRMIFRDMSVEENLIVGAFPAAHRAHARERLEASYAMFPRLRERRRQLAGALSGGEAQMLALARGLMSDPRLLIVDEPSLGLAPVMVTELFDILARLKREGRTIVLVEQNTERAVAIADHVYLMQTGKVVLSQPADQVSLPDLHRLYFSR